jgi:molybdopterin-guanine dinucleotide biosynthesis protein A
MIEHAKPEPDLSGFPELTAGVLIGGASKRMGVHKSTLTISDGCTILEHVVGVLQTFTNDVVLLGTGPPSPMPGDLPRLADVEANRGPASGLAALLHHAEDRWSILASCDLPRLTAPAIWKLVDQIDEGGDAVAYVADEEAGRFETCCTLYHPRILSVVLNELRAGTGSLQSVLKKVRTVGVAADDEIRDAILDVDTPEDWARVRDGVD